LSRHYIQKGAKTKAGERLLPLKKEVVRAFRDEMAKPRPPEEPEIDGVSGFVFLNQFRKAPTFETNWDHNCKRAVEKYNSIYKNELPNLTPHICRHTYCTLMATTGVSLQTLQRLMGHESIEITLKYYTHLKLDQTKEDLEKNGIV
jgi:integrase